MFPNRIRVGIVVGLLLVVLGTQAIGSVYATQSSTVMARRVVLTGAGFLRAEGQSIVDGTGNFVLLHGADFSGYEGPKALWSTHTEADYVRMASWGFNVVRLPIAWNWIEPSPGRYDDGYLSSYVDRDIKWARSQGLYIVLDMHQFGWSPYFTYFSSEGGNGFPSWAVSGYANTAEGEARARADFWSGKGPNGTSPSKKNPSLIDRFAEMWKHVAARYSSETTITAYDLFNEPSPFTMDGTAFLPSYDVKLCSETLPHFFERVVDAIRTVDSNHMILWEPAAIWNEMTSRVDRPNVVYSPHYPGFSPSYAIDGKGLSIYGYDGNKTRLEASLVSKVVTLSRDWNQPVLIGEWGICAEGPNAGQYTRDLADLMDKYLLSRTWWTYGRAGFGMYLLDGAGNERTAILQNLIRAYASSSSVRPSSSSFDPVAKEFQLIVAGPSVVGTYIPLFYQSFTAVADSGSCLTEIRGNVVLVTLPNGASQLVVSFQ